jgi:Fe-S cluster assembly protein SufD
MTAVKEKQDLYFAQFAALERDRAASDPAWLRSIRKAAIDRFAELGFPTTKNEEWKYTSVAPIARVPFQPVWAGEQISPEAGEPVAPPSTEADCSRLVFVDGRFSPDFSSLGTLSSGVKVSSLSQALENGAVPLEAHLARHADFQDHAFVALNTAFIEDGAFIEIARETVVEKAIYLVYISSAPEGKPVVSHPRNLIVVGRGAQATFVESYLGTNGTAYFTNAVTEVVVGENATVDYAKIEEEGEQAFHVATVHFHQQRSSAVHSTSIQFGGSLVREDMRTVLDGEGCESTLNGLYVIGGRQHVDNHTTIDHAKPHCGSRELYKGVLDGQATGVFNGKIIVRKDAQKTDSKQSNKNLLLSRDSVINTKPQLEIYADDVKCTHGATIGQIDQEAVFYLRSRGIGLDEARAMLTQAFASDVIGKIRFAPLRDRLKDTLLERLAEGHKSATRPQESGAPAARVSTLAEG